MRNSINLIGNLYGRLAVVSRIKNYKHKQTYYLCLCSCGGFNMISTSHLRNMNVRSCGCLRDEALIKRNKENSTHNLSTTPLYRLWININSRCYNKKDINYHNYGERGISVCNEWREDRVIFFNWAIKNGYSYGLEIDRIKNNKGYSPGNCRFVTRKVNCRNKRTNVYIEYGGEKRCLSEWAEIVGISKSTLRTRFKLGWSAERILTKKVR